MYVNYSTDLRLLLRHPVACSPPVNGLLIQAKYVADQISAGLSSGGGAGLRNGGTHVILAPRLLTTIQHVFEEEGLAGHVTLHQFAWEFIPLDFDLLSLEIPNFFRNQYLVQEWVNNRIR